jgi:type I restriction enzyme M protein
MKEIKKIFARALRKDQTEAEKIIWERLRKRKFMSLKFRRQHVVEGFVIDFYCHELKLGIEVDGGVHLKRKNYDQLRQEVIESEGISIIRITNKEIMEDKKTVLKKLGKAIGSSLTPLPLGEGRKVEINENDQTG